MGTLNQKNLFSLARKILKDQDLANLKENESLLVSFKAVIDSLFDTETLRLIEFRFCLYDIEVFRRPRTFLTADKEFRWTTGKAWGLWNDFQYILKRYIYDWPEHKRATSNSTVVRFANLVGTTDKPITTLGLSTRSIGALLDEGVYFFPELIQVCARGQCVFDVNCEKTWFSLKKIPGLGEVSILEILAVVRKSHP